MKININKRWADLFGAYNSTKSSVSTLYVLGNEMVNEIEFLRRSNAGLRGHLKRAKKLNKLEWR